jgi:hypothetical protein
MASLSKDGKFVFYIKSQKKQFRVSRLNKKTQAAALFKVDSILWRDL